MSIKITLLDANDDIYQPLLKTWRFVANFLISGACAAAK